MWPCVSDLAFTPSGRPVLGQGELEVHVEAGARVTYGSLGDGDTRFRRAIADNGCTIRVTTHRVIAHPDVPFPSAKDDDADDGNDNDDGERGENEKNVYRALAVPLSLVGSVTHRGGGLLGRVGFKRLGALTTRGTVSIAPAAGGGKPIECRVTGAGNSLATAVRNAVRQFALGQGQDGQQPRQPEQQHRNQKDDSRGAKENDRAPPLPPPSSSSPSSVPSRAGVSGLIATRRDESRRAGETARAAFTDLGALRSHAEAVVRLSANLRARAERDGTLAELHENERAWREALVGAGIASPVTRAHVAGRDTSKYTAELAREMCDFLLPRVTAARSRSLPLVEAFCVWNRARGAAFVPAAEFEAALGKCASLGLPLRAHAVAASDLRVLTLASDGDGDRSAVAGVVSLFDGSGAAGLTAMEVSIALETSLHLATAYIAMAEREGMLCRDEHPSGLTFFRNVLFCDA